MQFETEQKSLRRFLRQDAFRCAHCFRNPEQTYLRVVAALDNVTPLTRPFTICVDCIERPSLHQINDRPIFMEKELGVVADRKLQCDWYSAYLKSEKAKVRKSARGALEILGNDHSWLKEDLESTTIFVERLGPDRVTQAARIAASKDLVSRKARFKYFAGVCWNKILDR